MGISLIALVIGFGIDIVIGDPHSIPHPIVLIGKLISLCENILRNIFPKSKRGELIAGIILVIIVTVLSTAVPLIILILCGKVGSWLRLIVESIMCWQIIAAKSLQTESMKVYHSLESGNIGQARTDVSMIVGRDTQSLDDNGITKAAIETVAENTSDGVIAPMIYMAIGGAGLGFLYKAVNTMDSMVAYKNERYIYFGRCAAYLDDVFNYIPARLSAIGMIITSSITGLNSRNAYRIWRRDGRKHESPNSAQTEAVTAGALEIQLAGDASYGGILHHKEYIGDAIRNVEHKDIVRANSLMYATAVFTLILLVVIKAAIIIVYMN